MDNITISKGFADDERARVADLYWEAFRRKLRPGFSNEQAGLTVVRNSLIAEHVLTARRDGEIVGVCGFYDTGSGAVDLSWANLRRTLSVFAALRASVVLSVLSRPADPHVLVLDGICVDRDARGLGIGTLLLGAARDYAQSTGARRVRLAVVDNNPRARALYERQGFKAVDEGELGWLSVVYGFDRYTTMELGIE